MVSNTRAIQTHRTLDGPDARPQGIGTKTANNGWIRYPFLWDIGILHYIDIDNIPQI